MEAAYKLKYDDEYDFMKTEAEKPVGEEPPILDLLVLKKDPGMNLTDDIGSFFKENNVIVNKGCGDGININDVFKEQGYAAMHMSINKHVDEVPWESMTLTIVQFQHPRAALTRLKEMGCMIMERVDCCVWEISGPPIMFPFQLVDASKLGDDWAVIKAMIPGASEKTLQKVLKDYEQEIDSIKKQHLSVFVKFARANNRETVRKMKATGHMDDKIGEAVKYIFADELEAKEKQMAADFKAKEEEMVRAMLYDQVDVFLIEKWTKVPLGKIAGISRKENIRWLPSQNANKD